MEHLIEVVYVKNGIKTFNYVVNTGNYRIVKERLKYDYNKLVKKLKDYKDKDLIKSIFIPYNKKIQKELDEIVTAKRKIKKALFKINSLFN